MYNAYMEPTLIPTTQVSTVPQGESIRTSSSSRVLLELKDVKKIYYPGEKNENIALKGISFSVNEGEFVALTGQSGSGKSSLLNILGLLDMPSTGIINIHGQDVTLISSEDRADLRLKVISFVFQFFNLINNLTALENIMLPLQLQGKSFKEASEIGMRTLTSLDLAHSADVLARDLSGGEQQRVAIGRALCKESAIILADEPTAHLDSVRSQEVMDLLLKINKEYGRTIILVTHEREQARQAGRCLVIKDGLIVEDIHRIPVIDGTIV